MRNPKVKVSITLGADVVGTIDLEARRTNTTRSALIESYLRSGASRAAERSIEDATATYYASLRGPAKVEEEAIARATSRAAKKITYDAPIRRRTRRARKTKGRR